MGLNHEVAVSLLYVILHQRSIRHLLYSQNRTNDGEGGRFPLFGSSVDAQHFPNTTWFRSKIEAQTYRSGTNIGFGLTFADVLTFDV